MRTNRLLRPVPTFLIAVVALVVGLATPAAAHQARTIAHKISGSTIKEHSVAGNRLKNNTVTGTQVKESTLGTVPKAAIAANATNATELGGRAATDYASASAATASGLLKIPADGSSHVLFTRYPLVWSGTCTVSGSSDSYTLSITPEEAVVFTQGLPASSVGTPVAKGATIEVGNGGGNGAPVQTIDPYSVIGSDGVQYMGELMDGFKFAATPCAAAITAAG